MKLKRISSLLLFSGILFSACDKAEGWQEAAIDILPESERSTFLVEEYTGQLCVNCPVAAKDLKEIAKTSPSNVIIVSMHSKSTGQTLPELAATDADSYAELSGIPKSAPNVVINRQLLDGKKFSDDKAAWMGHIQRAVHTKAKFKLQLGAKTIDNNIVVNTNVKLLAGANRKVGLQYWVVEDIRTRQILPEGLKEDYFHHNVFRSALNGVKGQVIDVNSANDFTQESTFTTPSNVVDVNNAKVVAYVYDVNTLEVLEAVITPLGSGIVDTENPEEKPEENILESKDKTIWLTLGKVNGDVFIHQVLLMVRKEHVALFSPNLKFLLSIHMQVQNMVKEHTPLNLIS